MGNPETKGTTDVPDYFNHAESVVGSGETVFDNSEFRACAKKLNMKLHSLRKYKPGGEISSEEIPNISTEIVRSITAKLQEHGVYRYPEVWDGLINAIHGWYELPESQLNHALKLVRDDLNIIRRIVLVEHTWYWEALQKFNEFKGAYCKAYEAERDSRMN